MLNFDNIVIIVKPNEDTRTMQVVERIVAYGEERGINVSRDTPMHHDGTILIISVGGDGTMLGAMRASLEYENSTVLGLNTGTLGFLSEEVPDDLTQYLDNIRTDVGVNVEQRMLLTAAVTIDGNAILSDDRTLAVNEFVFTTQSIKAAMKTEVQINNQFVSGHLGNGVLVSTATGSTAMSLSSGGVIVSPATNTMQIVPILAHTLTARPIITSGEDTVILSTVFNDRVDIVEIHADGKCLFEINASMGKKVKLYITKHKVPVRIWRPIDWNFFNTLRNKMKW